MFLFSSLAAISFFYILPSTLSILDTRQAEIYTINFMWIFPSSFPLWYHQHNLRLANDFRNDISISNIIITAVLVLKYFP